MLGKRVLRVENDRVPYLKPTRIVVNWGSSEAFDAIPHCRVLNNPDNVGLASNKLYTFQRFSQFEVPCPKWTTDKAEAENWLSKGHTVFCRTRLQAHSGEGIVIATDLTSLVNAPLYTRYIKKKKEFRVHVFKGQVIDVQEKRRASHSPEAEFLIRNHSNGFVFCRENLVEPSDLRDVGIKAVSSLGLDFGGVDIVYNEHYDKCYALEVNTAVGLAGSTIEAYVKSFKEYAYGKQ